MRRTRDPYKVWLAEVVLQQTRMEQGLPYYHRLLEAFPDVNALASAPEDQLMKLWQGLGYYSRARNLQAAARQVMETWEGNMPATYRDLLTLKGVGTYTAAAIASWCFGEAVVALDGNVVRVIARLYGIEEAVNGTAGQKQVQELAEELLRLGQTSGRDFHPGEHNQAMIEFGALQCTPRAPRCGECPLYGACLARKSGLVNELPRKKKAKKPRERWFHFFLLQHQDRIFLEKREGHDIWHALYQFPMVESSGYREDDEILGPMLDQLLRPSDQKAPYRNSSLGKPSVGKPSDSELSDSDSSASDPSDSGYSYSDSSASVPSDSGYSYSDSSASDPSESELSDSDSSASDPSDLDPPNPPVHLRPPVRLRHILSHQIIHASFTRVELPDLPAAIAASWIPVPLDELDRYALPQLIHSYLETVNF